MSRQRVVLVRLGAVLLALALIAAACGGSSSSSKKANKGATPTAAGSSGTAADPGKPVSGGTLTFGQESDVATLDPSKALAQPADKNIGLAVYDSLMTFDDNGKVIPGLAESMKPNADLTEYTMVLRKSITFHDGTPFNADAVVAHITRLQDPATASTWVDDVKHITKVEKVDDSTVKFTLDGPQVAFADLLAGTIGYVPSPTAIQKEGKDFDQHPVGTGPFKLTEFIAGDHVTVVKNADYWRKDKDGHALPYLDKIVFKPIQDTKQRVQALKAGDVDMIQTADPSTIKEAEGGNLKIQKISGSSSTIILLNTTRPPTNDVRVRQAITYAFDKDALNKALWAGTRKIARSQFAVDSPYFDKAHGDPPYNPDKAKALLKAYGKPVSFTAECIPTPEGQQALEVAKQFWEAVGMKVTLKTTEQGQYVNRIFGTKDYQVACFRSAQFVDPDEGLYGGLHSGSATNLVNYSNKKVDAALDAGRRTPDVAERKKQYNIVQTELSKDVPLITLAYDLFTNIYKSSVHGLPVPEANSLGAIRPQTIWVQK